ncbi:hypothetical protein HYFRA_00013175 [Hymenoscyphus fraxineus]|uniref:Uncharacterized protein n=1 Tax=Hymenoscyphus fraxineus TaxID=746836 RepID=A0A9N9PYF1_9HELO|nr:hypothetical protein HYFRA_00013175 [Hymenoscyphus fraxineus]
MHPKNKKKKGDESAKSKPVGDKFDNYFAPNLMEDEAKQQAAVYESRIETARKMICTAEIRQMNMVV